MAWIIVADNHSREIDRRELAGPLVIGRAPQCDLSLHDIVLSRRHCIMECIGNTWVVADLGSKNGTIVNGQLINRHILQDGDVIRLGRLRICFREGQFVPAPPNTQKARQRPADPLEAMHGTMSGFRLSESQEQELDERVLENFPRPQPHPPDPKALQAEQVAALIADIQSSAWDTLLVESKKRSPASLLPRPIILSIEHPQVFPVPGIEHEATSARYTRWSRRHIALVCVLLGLTGARMLMMVWGW